MEENELTTNDIRELINSGKAHMVPEDEMKIYKENMYKRDHFEINEVGVRNLYAAVCMQAIADYRAAMRHRMVKNLANRAEAEKEAQECEEFFNGGFFKSIVGNKTINEIIVATRHIPDGGYNSYLKRTEKNKR